MEEKTLKVLGDNIVYWLYYPYSLNVVNMKEKLDK